MCIRVYCCHKHSKYKILRRNYNYKYILLVRIWTFESGDMIKCRFLPPAKIFFWGGDILVSPCPSVCVSVCPPSVDVTLSTHVLRNGCMVFLKICTTHYPLSKNVHLVFSSRLDDLSSFYRLFFCFWTRRVIS